MTLGQLIEKLKKLHPNTIIKLGSGYPGDFDSYRGYYSELALMPSSTPKTAGELLKQCRSALRQTFHGYKGGEYKMSKNTFLYAADYSQTGPQIVDLYNNTLIVDWSDVSTTQLIHEIMLLVQNERLRDIIKELGERLECK